MTNESPDTNGNNISSADPDNLTINPEQYSTLERNLGIAPLDELSNSDLHHSAMTTSPLGSAYFGIIFIWIAGFAIMFGAKEMANHTLIGLMVLIIPTLLLIICNMYTSRKYKRMSREELMAMIHHRKEVINDLEM